MNRARAKGSKFAKDVAEFLAANGQPYCERRVDGGTKDRGDLAGIPGYVGECKATRQIDLAGAMTEAKREAANAEVERYFSVIKRRNHTTADAYAVLPLWLLAELLREGA